MFKKISFPVCLLTCLLSAGIPLAAMAKPATEPVAPVKPSVSDTAKPQTPSAPETPPVNSKSPSPTPIQPQASSGLMLKDLPTGFEEIPTKIKSEILAQIQMLTQQVGFIIKPENVSAFWNPTSFQVIAGLTNPLSNQSEQAQFDGIIQSLQQPMALKTMLEEIQKKTPKANLVKILDSKLLSNLNNIGNASVGIGLMLEIQEQPMSVDLAAFRRNSMGAMTAILYLKDEKPAMKIDTLANKLDNHIQELSTVTMPAVSGVK